MLNNHRSPLTRKQKLGWSVASLVAIGAIVTAIVIAQPHPSESSVAASSNSKPAAGAPPIAQPTATPTPVAYEPAPATTGYATLATLPLASVTSVIPALLPQSAVKPVETWLDAAPTAPLTALYASPSTSAKPVAALGTQAVTDSTRVPVFGVDGQWLLIGTPSRITLPSQTNGGIAPAVSFAYVRASDFTQIPITEKVVVDTATSTISLVDKSGKIIDSQTATMGDDAVPTPSGGQWGYIESTYTDGVHQPWTCLDGTRGGCLSIALTSAHSPKTDSWNGSPAPTGIHWSSAGGTNSKGCVRVDVAMTKLLAPLVGIPVEFD
jgi:hypothetical protein